MNRSLLPFIFVALTHSISAQRLLPVLDADDTHPFAPMVGQVYSMCEWNDQLIVAGNIETFNDVEVNSVFAWNGEHAQTLGSGWNGLHISAVYPYANGLLAIGHENGLEITYFFDGNTWTLFSSTDFSGWVREIIQYNDVLIASGKFDGPAGGIAQWNGSNWVPLGEGLFSQFSNAAVYDMEVFQNELYVVGNFDSSDNSSFPYIAKWNGSEWSAVGAGLNNKAFALFVANNQLLVGGEFDATADGTVGLNYCAAWDGNNFSAINLETAHRVYAFEVWNNELIWIEDSDNPGMMWLKGENLNGVEYFSDIGPTNFDFPCMFVLDESCYVSVQSYDWLRLTSEVGTDSYTGLAMLGEGIQVTHFTPGYVNATLGTVQSFFQNISEGIAGFEVPAGGGVSPIYASAIWATGLLNGDTLAASPKYVQQGMSWPMGPVADEKTVEYLNRYEQLWHITQEEIDYHTNHYWETSYEMRHAIASWPGNGNTSNGEAGHLAPFMDINQNGWYEPSLGDYPIITGDEAVFFIVNDKFSVPEWDNHQPMNLEMHLMFYGYNSAQEPINNSIFLNSKIINRSENDYQEFRIGCWMDTDIGNAVDDYIGSDSLLMVQFGFNSDNVDEATSLSVGYGENPPACGNIFLSHQMGAASRYLAGFHPVSGEPTTPSDHFNYLRGKNKLGEDFIYGGTNQSPFIYNGSPCGNTDNELASENLPGDRRIVAGTLPQTFYHGDTICFNTAFTYFRDTMLNNFENACGLLNAVEEIHSFYSNNIPVCSITQYPLSTNEVRDEFGMVIFPNPGDQYFHIAFNSAGQSTTDIQLFDSIGRLIIDLKHKGEPGRQEIIYELPDLSSGCYWVRLTAGQKMETKGWIKL